MPPGLVRRQQTGQLHFITFSWRVAHTSNPTHTSGAPFMAQFYRDMIGSFARTREPIKSPHATGPRTKTTNRPATLHHLQLAGGPYIQSNPHLGCPIHGAVLSRHDWVIRANARTDKIPSCHRASYEDNKQASYTSSPSAGGWPIHPIQPTPRVPHSWRSFIAT